MSCFGREGEFGAGVKATLSCVAGGEKLVCEKWREGEVTIGLKNGETPKCHRFKKI